MLIFRFMLLYYKLTLIDYQSFNNKNPFIDISHSQFSVLNLTPKSTIYCFFKLDYLRKFTKNKNFLFDLIDV